ncbi:MAG TPA: hypothetical protein VEX18_09535 [Polyangiaceae bacterium]|nr:hypothetical protein [Polyangiaceae bacterium]
MLEKLACLGLPLWLVACGAAAGPPPAAAPNAANAAGSDAASGGEPGPSRAASEAPRGLPPADPACAAYAGAAASGCPAGDLTEQLAAALSLSGAERDAQLRCMEHAQSTPAGVIRALRADLAPRGCGDVVVGSEGSMPRAPQATREVADALVALRVGAQLYRSVQNPPLPRAPFDKATFLKHFKEVLSPWIAEQARAVDALSKVGPRLSGYGKAVVALEAGLADMRFVTVARSIALPDEMKSDPEIRETYLVALEQALEPRVARGRDAALVGLGELSRHGVTSDVRLFEARQLLSELYAGRRIDALDKLLLPALPDLDTSSAALKVAAKLPAFYALKLSASPNVVDPKLLRARMEQGVPPGLWLGQLPTEPALAALAQRALFQLGQTYFWAEPFGRAAAVKVPAQDRDAALLGALAKLLAKGPRNAAAMMLGPPTLPPELRDTTELDALAKDKTASAGLAEFDAAYVRGLAPPANDPAFWKEQATRYQRAHKKLADKAAQERAAELAKAAQDTEKELRSHR